MITEWKGIKIDSTKEYKIDTVASVKGDDNPWYVINLRYVPSAHWFNFKSTTDFSDYGMPERNAVEITEVENGKVYLEFK